MKHFAKLALSSMVIAFFSVSLSAQNSDRVCHKDWCYTGDKENSVTSSVLPSSGDDNLEMGAYVFRSRIEFWEMPFKKGRYNIKANVITNRYGKLVVEEVLNSPAKNKDGVIVVQIGAGLADKLKAGRLFKVRIYRDDKLDYSANYPLYGFSKAMRHMH